MAEDLERRLNILFDALNCETLSPPVCEQLIGLTQGMRIVLAEEPSTEGSFL